jgi:hypothetical protein
MHTKLLSVLFLATILTACGNGNNNDQQAVGTYGYSQNGVSGQGGTCPQQTSSDWNQLVAGRCNNVTGQGDQGCAQGLQFFIQRNQQFVQGAGCSIATSQAQWCPGNNWRGQSTFQVNQQILQTMLTQVGSAYPLYNQQQGYNVGPNQGGQGYGPNNF